MEDYPNETKDVRCGRWSTKIFWCVLHSCESLNYCANRHSYSNIDGAQIANDASVVIQIASPHCPSQVTIFATVVLEKVELGGNRRLEGMKGWGGAMFKSDHCKDVEMASVTIETIRSKRWESLLWLPLIRAIPSSVFL